MADISVLTASVPERGALLAEAIASVSAQTLRPTVHLVGVDHARAGAADIYNRLARATDTEWLCFLDDDDLYDPEHLATLMGSVNEDPEIDVVYTWCHTNNPYCTYNVPFDAAQLAASSIVPVTALVRRSYYEKVEGMRTEWGYDWRLWQRISTAGGRFRSLPAKTWTYRWRVGPDHKHQSLGEI